MHSSIIILLLFPFFSSFFLSFCDFFVIFLSFYLLLVRRPEGKDFAFVEFSNPNAARVAMECCSGK